MLSREICVIRPRERGVQAPCQWPHSCHYHNISQNNSIETCQNVRWFLCPSNIEMKSSDLMLWKFESANIYLSECGGKLPPLTLIFSSNTNIPQLHSLSFSSSRSVIWISSSENLFFLINIPNYPAAASRASHQSYCQQSMCRHWVVRIIQWYSCYSLGFVIIPGISTFSQNKVSPFQIFD